MVTELQDLLRRNVEDAPPDHVDLADVVATGRQRVRRRRALVAGAGALATAAAVALTAVSWPTGSDHAGPASPPRPDAPTVHLAGADQAVQGRDYDLVTSYTNKNLDRANGEYLDGVTDDGLILFREGPRDANGWQASYALMDPATGDKDQLPDPGFGQDNIRPVELGADRLVLLGDNGTGHATTAYVFDRQAREWSTTSWPGLPRKAQLGADLGPDGRLYLRVPATQGRIPEGGWPVDESGEADDADAEGDTYDLWSVSPTDGSDVRDEHLRLGSLAFTDSSMVWTDSTNGHAGLVHVRDLATGAEHSFDPHAGARCNLLSFSATDDRVVMGQYCGTYADGVRDDRVQILSTDGDQVVTIQDNGIDGGIASPGSDVVSISALSGGDSDGTYLYELDTNRMLRVSDGVGSYSDGGGPATAGQFFWSTPVNGTRGATQWLGALLD